MIKQKVVASFLIAGCCIVNLNAQTQTDSLRQEARSYVARNFSQARTFNLYWETMPNHNYTFKQNGKTLENGRMNSINTVKFQTTIPVLTLKHFSLYINGQFNSYQFNADENSEIFHEKEEGYNYYEGAVSGTYHTKIFKKPLILTASISGDGWNKGFGMIGGFASAILVLKNTERQSFSVGLAGMTLNELTPVIPIIAYTYKFSPQLSVDITLPSKCYLRYQVGKNHRFSLGTSMEGNHFYLKTGREDLPEVNYFSETIIKPELVYECILNKHVYFIVRGGGQSVINGGLYDKDRKGEKRSEPYYKYTYPMRPFFNLGFSYNLFK